MKKAGLLLGTVAAGIFLGLQSVTADIKAKADAKSKTKAETIDPAARDILASLHQANQDEIEMGKMAKAQGASEDVKAYGERLIKDHSEADSQVKQVAKTVGVQLSPSPAKEADAKVDKQQSDDIMSRLHKLSGAEFDKAFAAVMVKDHEKDIAKLKDAEARLAPSPVRNLVVQVLPKLEDHLQIAQKIQQNS